MNRVPLLLMLLFSAWNSAVAADNLTRLEWKVNGVSRERWSTHQRRPRLFPPQSYSPSTGMAAR